MPMIIADKYRVIKKLGSGAFGSVYKAEQIAFGVSMRTVALKVFQTDVSSPSRAREIFNDALVLSNLLQHCGDPAVYTGIVQIYDVGSYMEKDENGRSVSRGYMAMEMMDKDLRTIIGRTGGSAFQRCTVKETLNYLKPVINSLAYMHSQNQPILHRDLKPENILLKYRKQLNVKIGDFGLAVPKFDRLGDPRAAGTLLYQDLESFSDQSATTQSDIFAIGIIFYELLTGKYPFNTAYLRAHRNDSISRKIFMDRAHLSLTAKIQPPSEINYELKKDLWLESIILKCLTPFRSSRIKDAVTLKRRIENPGHGWNGLSLRDIYKDCLKTGEAMVAKGPAYWEDAENCFKKALSTSHRFCDAVSRLADLYIRQNKLEEAEILLREACDRNECSCYFGGLADVYAAKNNDPLSEIYLEEKKKKGVCSKSVFD